MHQVLHQRDYIDYRCQERRIEAGSLSKSRLKRAIEPETLKKARKHKLEEKHIYK